MATKQEIIQQYLTAYLKGSRKDKGRILSLVTDVTGMHRKAVVRRFRTLQMADRASKKRPGPRRRYGPDVTAALKELWNLAHHICAERLRPMIPEYVRLLQRDGVWQYGSGTTAQLLHASIATLKRRIASFEKFGRRGGRGTTKPSELKEIIPIRRGPWKNPPPGKGEIDTVAHCGNTLVGDFAYTVQYTDVATTWTCLSAQGNKGEVETQRSIARIEIHLPFPLLGIDPDSGSEFINWHVKGWCDEKKIEMTRTRPYMKNDHARIEQKNYANVRAFVGYARFDLPEQVVILNALYDLLEDYLNFFIPSVKCVAKIRIGSRTIRTYDMPQTAYQRVLVHQEISQEVKERLRQKYATLSLLALKKQLDASLKKLLKSAEKTSGLR